MEASDPCSDVRTRILNAATRLFGRKGFSATSVREVVEAAGVTKPTLYYYFGNKEALFAEAVGAQLDGLRSFIDALVQAQGPCRGRLHAFLELYVRGAIENPDKVRLMMTATAPTDASQPKVVTIERFRAELERLGDIFLQGSTRGELRADLDCEMAVALLVGAADLMLISGLSGVPVPDDFADRILTTLLEGLAP